MPVVVFVDSGGLDATITHSDVTIGHVVYSRDDDNEASVSAPNYDVLFTKEFYNLFFSLEAASSGYVKEIACAKKAATGIIKKMGMSLRSKRKKSDPTRKTSTIA
jgi:hypothetical protein